MPRTRELDFVSAAWLWRAALQHGDRQGTWQRGLYQKLLQEEENSNACENSFRRALAIRAKAKKHCHRRFHQKDKGTYPGLREPLGKKHAGGPAPQGALGH